VTAVNFQTWRGCRGRTHDASFRCAKGGGAAGARRGGGGGRVMWVFNQKRADQVAPSISQLIHTPLDGRKNHGPTSPERLLRELATLLSEDTIIGQRVVKLLMATTTKAKFLVSLATAPDHSSHRLTFDGRGVYSGFSLACFLPPRTVMID